ncbi:aldo/keto reductase [Eubacteriales bacterium OttesenSCG-928-M02]|nr:aldo/keto reductase [Eubacteriales bacterium OttesenSCG-928-M02]
MKYRKFGKLDFEVSTFGMGCMRMPQEERADGTKGFDHKESIRMIHRAIEGGVNYFDTANAYGADGECEKVLGEALAIGGRREGVKIATKISPRLCTSEDAIREVFEEECRRLQTNYIDFYLIHQLDEGERYGYMVDYDILSTFEKLKAEGRIKHIGFSYHGNYENWKRCLDYYDGWEMAQPQFNILDINRQASVEGIRYAGKKGVPVVVMEPLKGGNLAEVPPEIQAMYDSFPVKRTPVEWGFAFVADYPEIACILSGVSTMDQLEDNLRIFSELEANSLTKEEMDFIYSINAAYDKMIPVPCTGCRYCVPCPAGVDIPGIFSLYNSASLSGGHFEEYKGSYNRIAMGRSGGKAADACVACGACERECPQGIPIIEKLKEAHAALG